MDTLMPRFCPVCGRPLTQQKSAGYNPFTGHLEEEKLALVCSQHGILHCTWVQKDGKWENLNDVR